MAVPSGRLQFFALEATDYLERLALLAGRATQPDPDELVRLTRALRGAALMAGLSSFAQAAAALEQIAKTFRDEPAAWTADRARTVATAVESLRDLARRAPEWSDFDSNAATDLARQLSGSVVSPPARPADDETDELKASVRAFVGREGASIAGTLEHAAQTLELGRPAEAAGLVLPRLQPLRGLATLPQLSPLPEFLDAIELTIRSLRDETAPPSGAGALRRAAAAVTRLAREIADQGKAGADTPEVVLGAVSLLESFGRDDDVIDIDHLFHDGDPDPIVRQGPEPSDEAGGDGILELVSLADRFRQAADQLAAPAASTVGRTLYLYGLLVQLRPVTQAAPRGRPYLAGLLSRVAIAIGRGTASRDPGGFAAALTEAADQIARAAETRNVVFLADELAPVLGRLDALLAAAARLAEPVPGSPVRASEAGGDDESDVVPIEALAPDPVAAASTRRSGIRDEPEPVPIESLAPDSAPAPVATIPMGVFAASFSTYFRLKAGSSAPAPGLEPIAVPVEVEPDRDVVPITTLLLRGRRALERADTVRIELSGALKNRLPFVEIEPLVSELIDLVPLALEE